ncbi:MAG: phosphomannomutase [Haloquadratum walsbyi J07HQW2]|uniref:Phosphomannomutase n=1 Tax=Haloquadratum walsbyi J07HQW2 TaxID=1238425 RepID=U1NFT4_9EURY|nr:MAG: phosphomannomutase [Haloquadratum walsbyi J07HQW2]
MNATPDGHFPGRPSEPIASNLTALRSLVTASGADVGIAHDGDADRAVFIDEQGQQISGEASLAALAAAELDSNSATVAAVNVSQRLVDVCNRVDATLELTPIGSTNIITKIRELQTADISVPIAGEGNGGVFFPNFRLVRDGAYIAAKFLRLICDQPASSIIEPYTEYANVRTNIEYDSEEGLEALMMSAQEFAEEADVTPNTVDGYRLDYGDAWVLIRPSGTEPVVRVYTEADKKSRAQKLADAAANKLYDAVDDVR